MLIAAALLAAILAVAYVQTRQDSMLRESVRTGDDYTVLAVYQVELEYLRLRETWQRAIAEGAKLDREALQLRYDIFVSRLDLMESERHRSVMPRNGEHAATLRSLQGFVNQADRILGPGVASGIDPRQMSIELEALLPALLSLGSPVHDLTLHAAHQVAIQMSERNDAVRRHNQIGIGLTIFLSALTLAFALIAWRQLRQLEERRAGLEQLAESLREARQQADAANAAKSRFLAQMSHELRTPFQGMLGMLALLRETPLDARQVDYLRTATGSAEHLLALLEDILDLSQLESGRLQIDPGVVRLRGLLREVEALMQAPASARQLGLEVDVEPTLPDSIVTDGKRLKQVLFNLLSNALKFSQRGVVTLTARSGQGANGQSLLEFTVSDPGVGMDDATLAGVLGRGPRVKHAQPGTGAGLGLEICRNLARLLGGELAGRSVPGVGTVFTFTVPLQPAQEPAPAALASPLAPSLQPLRVLVAEDQPVNRQYLEAVLQGLGHTAEFAANGQLAVEALQAASANGQRFDLVLMDLHMPVLDGAEATRVIRALADRAAATVPIVGLTADAFAETRERCLVAGMNEFLTKPVSPQQLGATLRRFFGEAAGPPDEFDLSSQVQPGTADAGPQPLVDSHRLASALQGMSRERMGALVDLYLDEAVATATQLRAAVRDGQPGQIGALAHGARGAALNLGLAALAATAEALRQGANHLPALEIARLIQRFEQQIVETRGAAADAGLPVRADGREKPVVHA